MLKHWWGVALLAAWLSQASGARAQYLPSELGATRMFDPEPVKPTKPLPNNLVPGPLTPDLAPPGPPDPLGDFHDLHPSLSWGIRGGFMVVGQNTGLELNGFAIHRQSDETTVISPSIETTGLVQQVLNAPGDVRANPNPPVGFPPG